jgi:pimeloyl-ACP methyl ester carboxylesterase
VTERFAHISDDIRLCYETFGDPDDPTVLLVMGLGTQMIAWNDEFCERLADRGFHVVRFDNRDTGRSTHLRHLRPPSLKQLALRDGRAAHYTLEDMADDAVALLDHLDVDKAHVVGASMGGMIAQSLAAHHADRVHSLVSIMSTTGNRWKGQPALRTMPMFLSKPPRDPDAYAERTRKVFNLIGSSGFERDDEAIERLARRSWERGVNSASTGRQIAAIFASGDRTEMLREIRVPTLVIHGAQDRMVNVSGGRATAEAIPGAKLCIIEGMGHDIPRGVWDQIIDGIVDTAARAEDQLNSATTTTTATITKSTA